MTTHVLRVPVSTNDTGLPVAIRDDLMKDDNGGVLFCADLGFGWSYPAGSIPRPAATDPIAGALIRDMSTNKADAISGSKGNISYLGGGFNFAGIVSGETGFIVPASVHAQMKANEQFMVCVYMRLPALNAWNTQPSIAAMVSGALGTTTYQTGAESVLLAQQKPTETNGILTARIQTGPNAVANATVSIPTGEGFYDSGIVQIGMYIENGRFNLRVRNEISAYSSSAVFTGNSEDYSSQPFKIGGSPAGFECIGSKSNYRVYRTFIEDLSISGRDPLTVLSDDYDRVIARGVFS